jgi:hypothetical protein
MAYSKKMKKSSKGTRKHKSWNMKGCSKRHRKQKGGCNSCITGGLQHGGSKSKMFGSAFSKSGIKGGNFYKHAAPIPGPFVGQPWTPAISGWPGVDGVGANRNYIADNLYPTDISRQMKVNGGAKLNKSKSKKHKTIKMTKMTKIHKRGGSIIPQDLTNLGRELTFSVGSAYNALNGYPLPVNPAPYVQPSLNTPAVII